MQHVQCLATAARAEGRTLDQVPAGVAMPAPSWNYDRLNPAAPLEGLEMAISHRFRQCVPRQYARKRQDGIHCAEGPAREHLEELLALTRRRGEMPAPKPARLPIYAQDRMTQDELFDRFTAAAAGHEHARWRQRLGIELDVGLDLFLDARGAWKIKKNGRARWLAYLADTIIDPAEVRMLTDTTGAPQLWLFGSYAVRGGLLTKIVFELAGRSRLWTGVSAYDLDRKLLARNRSKTSLLYARKD